MLVRDVMSSKVISISRNATLYDAVKLMIEYSISGMPVLDEKGAPVGIVSEGDLLRRIEIGTEQTKPGWVRSLLHPGQLAEVYARNRGRRVNEIMTDGVYSVTPAASLEEAVASMETNHVKRLPVVDGSSLVGIITRADIVRALFGALATPHDKPKISDAEIENKIIAELRRQSWAPVASITVQAREGIVELHGVLTDERQRSAICVVAENVAGVREVHDHLVWAEPYGGFTLQSAEDQATENAAANPERIARPS